MCHKAVCAAAETPGDTLRLGMGGSCFDVARRYSARSRPVAVLLLASVLLLALGERVVALGARALAPC